MERFKRTVCLIICTIFILNLAGCAVRNNEERKAMVLNSCEKITEYVTSQDYSSLSAYLYEDNEKLRDRFTLGEGRDDEETVAVRKAIAATMRSQILNDTIEFSGYLDRFATIKVKFMIVDYQGFAKNNKYYRNVGALEEAVNKYDLLQYVLIYTLPMRFVFKDGKAVWENSEMLENIFDFAEFDEIVMADNLTKYLTGYTFVDAENDTYTEPKKISLEIALDEKGSRFDWVYDYEVRYKGTLGEEEVLAEDSGEAGRGSESILINYATSKVLKAGTYSIVLKYDGEQTEYTCNVVDKPEDLSEGVFRCPDGKSYNIKLSDVKVELPDGYFFVDAKSSLGNDILKTFGKDQVEFIVSDDDGDFSFEFLYCLTVFFADYAHSGDKVTDEQIRDYMTEARKELYETMGYKTTVKKDKIKIGGRNYKSSDIKLTGGGMTSYLRFIVIPTDVDFHVVTIYAQTEKALKTYTSMLK